MPAAEQTGQKGRPSKITSVVGSRDGQPITAADRVVEFVRAGNYIETAAHAAGIAKSSVYEWLHVAANAGGKLHRGERLTPHERRCVTFSDAVSQAEAESEAEDVARLAQLARGGLTTKVVTVKVNADGTELERTERTETLAPSDRVLMWRLERRFARRWGHQGSLAVSGVVGTVPLEGEGAMAESAREALGDVLSVMAERLARVELVGGGTAGDGPLLAATEERPGEDDPPDL